MLKFYSKSSSRVLLHNNNSKINFFNHHSGNSSLFTRFFAHSSLSSKLSDPSLFQESNYVNGSWISSSSGLTSSVYNPSTGDLIGKIPNMNNNDTNTAISHAHNAFLQWRVLTGKQRGDYIRKWFNLMMAADKDLAKIMTTEQGKPLNEALGEIHYAAGFLELYAEEASRIYGELIPSTSTSNRIMVIRQPVGVVGAITPWNFPAAMITRKVAAGMAAGCTVVLKPAETTPYTALALCQLAHRAGIPKGVINVITGEYIHTTCSNLVLT